MQSQITQCTSELSQRALAYSWAAPSENEQEWKSILYLNPLSSACDTSLLQGCRPSRWMTVICLLPKVLAMESAILTSCVIINKINSLAPNDLEVVYLQTLPFPSACRCPFSSKELHFVVQIIGGPGVLVNSLSLSLLQTDNKTY